MGAETHDYDKLEREYIRGKMSIRELCRSYDIKSYSAVAAKARQRGWYAKREQFQERVSEKTIDRLAEQEADVATTMRSEMLTVIRAALYKFAEDLKLPDYHIAPQDLVKLSNLALLLLGEPTSRTEEKTLALTGDIAGLDPELVRALAGAARAAKSQRLSIGTAPGPLAANPRPD